ncbi:J domain-containing protein [Salmonirosea aquatica]|uniref:J domain-containing protein n=1 Tax=Salmonirosea aquatica TaxID=2654236 RepID=A0A7C9BGB0_9BACT|nr:hypothetical protein [Cytophagaceae bacterium SJW1-29]
MKQRLVYKKRATTKSKLQARYEKLLKDIGESQSLHHTLEQGLREVVPRIQSELRPLIGRRDELLRSRLLRLDELADELGIGKYDRPWFDGYMADQASELLKKNGYGDEILKELFEKYAGEPLLSDEKNLAPIARQLKDELGIDMDLREMVDKGVDTFVKEHSEEIRKKMLEKWETGQAEDLKNFEPDAPLQVDKQQQALLQDARAIYLRLVKKYHPDRETDEAAKIQKTELIQRVTKAYQENDFLALLKLQIEYLEEEEADAFWLAEDMLKRYNKILQKQLNEIRKEVDFLKHSSMGLREEFFDQTHAFSERKFKNFKKKLRAEITMIQADLNDSRKHQKSWFKDWTPEIKAYQQDARLQNASPQPFDI